jgi:benzil reductase ((S)-benzoin forming)
MSDVVWVTGASSGIGAAVAAIAADRGARVIGVARRPTAVGEHLAADLSDPAAWRRVAASFDEVLAAGSATLMHFAAQGAPHGHAADVDHDEYTRAVLLNSASGQVLAQAFAAACARAGIAPTIVLCSSPAMLEPHTGLSHYGAAKAAFEYWAAAVRLEDPAAVVFTVVPFSVDTPLLRRVMELPAEVDPIAEELRALRDRGELATPESTATEIWAAVDRRANAPVLVGAVPAALR